MISELRLSEAVRNVGIRPVRLYGLERVVVLAGPNGAGKSRYLLEIEKAAKLAALRTDELRGLESELRSLERLRPADRLAVPGGHRFRGLRDSVTNARAEEAAVSFTSKPRSIVNIGRSSGDEAIVDADAVGSVAIGASLQQTQNPGLGNAAQGSHAYLRWIAQDIWNSDNPRASSNPELGARLKDATAFNKLLMQLLGTAVEPEFADGVVLAALGGRRFKKEELSAGEKLLIAWAIALHRQGAHLADSIVFLDEPENHLHPHACLLALKRLIAALGSEGQVWIATHSVPVVALQSTRSLYLVNNNQLERATTKTAEVMESLLGGPEGRANVAAMLDESDRVLAARFFAECLVPPEVVDTPADDRQASLLRSAVESARSADQPLRVLDFGAGKGRLAGALADLHASGTLQYHAFNRPPVSDADTASCLAYIASLGIEHPLDRYSMSVTDLTTAAGNSFDVIILCNVLHEVAPCDWLTLASDVGGLLAEDGLLLVMEDLAPPIGELPHETGHIMLDEVAVRTLLGDHRGVKLAKASDDGRLVVIEAPKAALACATAATRTSTLNQVQRSALERLREVRSAPANFRRPALAHAHAAIQFANASIALKRA